MRTQQAGKILLITIVGVMMLFSSAFGQGFRSAENKVMFKGPHGETINGYRCGTPSPTPDQLQKVQRAIGQLSVERMAELKTSVVTIPVAVHVVRHSDGKTGDVTDAQIQSQLNVLNAAYADLSYQFTLLSIDRTNNTTWSTVGSEGTTEATMKAALAVDPAHTLNLYICDISEGVLGWSYLPDSFPENDSMNGVVILYTTLPGGTAEPYNEGDTGTHEVGHYLGLYHTFQGGCFPPGDMVSDTPAERSASYGCPVGQDTCRAPGDDPIYNFMNYTDDPCMDEFTAGQGERINTMLAVYKPSLLAGTPASSQLAGCLDFNALPLDKGRAILLQPGQTPQFTLLENGCYQFDSVVPSMQFKIDLSGFPVGSAKSTLEGCLEFNDQPIGLARGIFRQLNQSLRYTPLKDGCFAFNSVDPKKKFNVLITGELAAD